MDSNYFKALYLGRGGGRWNKRKKETREGRFVRVIKIRIGGGGTKGGVIKIEERRAKKGDERLSKKG